MVTDESQSGELAKLGCRRLVIVGGISHPIQHPLAPFTGAKETELFSLVFKVRQHRSMGDGSFSFIAQ